MANAIPTQCTMPGCPRFASRGQRCSLHSRRKPNTAPTRDQARAMPSLSQQERKALYSTAQWQRLRLLKLHQDPLCEHCRRPAQEVDHIVPTSQGGEMWDFENLQALCSPCHYAKSRQDAAKRRTKPQQQHFDELGRVRVRGEGGSNL